MVGVTVLSVAEEKKDEQLLHRIYIAKLQNTRHANPYIEVEVSQLEDCFLMNNIH